MNTLSIINSILPELVLFFCGITLILFGSYLRTTVNFNFNNIKGIFLIAILGTLIYVKPQPLVFEESFINNDLTRIIKFFLVSIALFINYISYSYQKNNSLNLFEYPILTTFSLLGMMVMVSANDLMLLYVSIELQSLSLYVLVALRRDSLKSSEAALKYFILGSIASAVILYGASMIYSVTGTTNYTIIRDTVLNNNSEIVFSFGLILILSGIAFKLSAAPFHMWTPDVYEGSPTSVTTFLVTLPKLAALVVLIKLLFGPFINQIDIWQQILIIITVLSIVIGSISALRQENLKRLFAFSTIGNIGYVFMGIVIATKNGIAASLLYLVLYTLGTLGVFSFIMILRRDDKQLENIADVAGLSKTNPTIAISMVVLLLSMAGIPPFAGFFAKLNLFIAIIEEGYYYLAIIGVLFSVISAFYYLKIIKIMYLDDLSEPININLDKKLTFSITAIASIMVLFIFYADSFISFISNLRLI